jgi:hypothetical protein
VVLVIAACREWADLARPAALGPAAPGEDVATEEEEEEEEG